MGAGEGFVLGGLAAGLAAIVIVKTPGCIRGAKRDAGFWWPRGHVNRPPGGLLPSIRSVVQSVTPRNGSARNVSADLPS